MIPQQNDDLTVDFEEITLPSKTYMLIKDKNRIVGNIDELESLKQAIFLMLSIERYDYLIYSWNYGVEFNDLIGQSTDYVLPEVKRRIIEALVQDDRITSVDSFGFQINKKKVHASFTVHSIFGDVEEERTVSI
ncbi:DUF2634 domain-containing protein [Psychrobacillus sp. BM2]|uniref:DUF2634 domain-containing protein n=1 Tax=Psychrobacillus sp. BM2 TaxID=3400421 RepID=UPI003B021A80